MNAKQSARYEMPHYTQYDLYTMDKELIVWAYCLLQGKYEDLRDHEYADLEERYQILRVRAFGRSSEKSSILKGKASKDTGESTEEAGIGENPKEDGGDKKSRENCADAGNGRKGKRRPVRSKGCASKVTSDLPIIDEDIQLTAEELEAIFVLAPT